MKGATSIQERLWELRKDKGLNLEELSQKTGISKSALASYESDDNKEINHGSLIALADFYEVSIDYLFCRTENREQINTMDSMLGYKNEKYLYFGRAAAKLDDVANYIPSRLAALLWVAAAAFTGNDARGAWRIWRRDRRNHASPNSAQTESACAGALGVQLAGPAYYFGEYYPKPTIGDVLRPIEPQDILRANRMMYVASGFALAWGAAIRGFLA